MVTTTPRPAHAVLAQLEDNSILDNIAIAEMFVPPFGRPVGAAQLGRMLRSGFDPRKLGIIVLSMRSDGRFAILDGNHRRTIAAHAGRTHMLARVFIDLTYEEEADLFSALNTVKPPSALDRFRARLEAKEPKALGIKHIMDHYDLRFTKPPAGHARTHCMTAVGAVEKAYDTLGPAGLADILGVIVKAWDYDAGSFTSGPIEGLRHVWMRYAQDLDKDRLIAQLQRTTPHRLLATAGVMTTSNENAGTRVGRAVVELYNRNLKGRRLGEWKERVFFNGKAGTESSSDYYVGRRILERTDG